jgi:26S proteasome regulatory subunit T2
MGNQQQGGGLPFPNMNKKKDEKPQRKPEQQSSKNARKKKQKGVDAAIKLPTVFPNNKCRLRKLRLDRIKDYLLLEKEFIVN